MARAADSMLYRAYPILDVEVYIVSSYPTASFAVASKSLVWPADHGLCFREGLQTDKRFLHRNAGPIILLVLPLLRADIRLAMIYLRDTVHTSCSR